MKYVSSVFFIFFNFFSCLRERESDRAGVGEGLCKLWREGRSDAWVVIWDKGSKEVGSRNRRAIAGGEELKKGGQTAFSVGHCQICL